MNFEMYSAPFHQQGSGFKRYWKNLKPILKKTGERALKRGMRFGARVASDVVFRRQPLGKAVKNRVKQTISEIQAGKGKKLFLKRPVSQSTAQIDDRNKRRKIDSSKAIKVNSSPELNRKLLTSTRAGRQSRKADIFD